MPLPPHLFGHGAAVVLLLLAGGATARAQARTSVPPGAAQPPTLHVFVALCDNQYQGIVPVPAALGNGTDPDGNLYCGAAYGVRTYLSRHPDWERLATLRPRSGPVLERCVFRRRQGDLLLVADAYAGRHIRRAIADFLLACGGARSGPVPGPVAGEAPYGAARFVAYVGHDGLMEFSLRLPPPAGGPGKPAAVLACSSQTYFREPLRRAGCPTALVTTGFMAPEAYALEAIASGWAAGEDMERLRERAAVAYDRYQHCGLNAARRLFIIEDGGGSLTGVTALP